MSQLQLFSNDPVADDLLDSPSTNSLIAQTRQLFHHQGSNAELIERIKAVIKVIDERCGTSNVN